MSVNKYGVTGCSKSLQVRQTHPLDECNEYIARNGLAWFTTFLRCVLAGEWHNAKVCLGAANNPGMWCVDRDAIESREMN